MNIDTYDTLIKHISNYNDEVDEEGNKNTGFDDDMLTVLDIITIYLKMKEAKVLNNNSRVFKAYERFKNDPKAQWNRVRAENEKKVPPSEKKPVDPEVAAKEKAEREAEIDRMTDAMMENYTCLYSHLESLLLSIEVTDEKGTTQTVFFPNYPVFGSLAGNLRDHIMIKVIRDSHRDKIVSLLAYTDGVKEKMESSYNLEKKDNITEENMDQSFKVAGTLSVIICIYITLFYRISVADFEAEYYSSFLGSTTQLALSLLQLTFSILFVYYWARLQLWREPETINREASSQEEGEEDPAGGDEEKEED
jgi:hypothetical protein